VLVPQQKISPATATAAMPFPEPLLVPLSEAARLLGVRIYSIRRLTRRGVLPYRVVGNKWLVPFASLKAFANGTLPTKRAA